MISQQLCRCGTHIPQKRMDAGLYRTDAGVYRTDARVYRTDARVYRTDARVLFDEFTP